ncbi:MAG: DVUA0089 family protein, partial [Azoarcus sp.]|nr:DVUA0089 family protein [Azoarcus sp.]
MKAKILCLCMLAALPLSASAVTFHFTGDLFEHNEIISIPFTLDDEAIDVKLWTDSFLDGLNFDPIAALWADDGAGNGSLIDWNDDNPGIHTTQTFGDAGLLLPSLAAGDYFLTVTAAGNIPLGSLFSDGFLFGTDAPTTLAAGSTAWSLWLTATPPPASGGAGVPEPSLLGLLGVG